MSKISYISDLSSWESEFYFFIPVKVRFSETDMYGHLNNTVPFTYFEEARIEFLKELGLMQKWTEENHDGMVVVADLQCDFLRQVFFDEKLKVFVKAESVGNSSVDLHYMAKNEKEEICFVGRGTVVQFSKKFGKAIPWSESFRKVIQENFKVTI
ncbi:acyl-CoA thioesterase [Bacillus dakarensis]|uniref:acyl-CoA thioesterase n=1 Tax=Robertmurraya dakarensis TaxID=1926278 RepID=UPI00098197D3|nr:thioesterase family protein [Bacillus dakarensis]